MAKAKESKIDSFESLEKQLIGHLMNAIAYMSEDKTYEGIPLHATARFLRGYVDALVLKQIDLKNNYFDVAESEKSQIN